MTTNNLDLNDNTKSYRNFLLGLLLIDFIIVLAHFYNSVLIPDEQYSPFLSLVVDRSLGEVFQYIKWLFIAVVFVLIAKKQSAIGYVSWALLFLYLLLDDSLELHEKIGGYLVRDMTATPPLGLRTQDIGELAVTAIAGGLLSILLLWSYIKGNTLFRSITKDMLWLMLGLAIFGIGIDMLGQMVPPGRGIYFILGIIEDGGEMIIASAMACYIYIALDVPEKAEISRLLNFLRNFQLKRYF